MDIITLEMAKNYTDKKNGVGGIPRIKIPLIGTSSATILTESESAAFREAAENNMDVVVCSVEEQWTAFAILQKDDYTGGYPVYTFQRFSVGSEVIDLSMYTCVPGVIVGLEGDGWIINVETARLNAE